MEIEGIISFDDNKSIPMESIPEDPSKCIEIENYETSYIIISWLCWIPNLLIAEFYVNKSNKIFSNIIDIQEESNKTVI